MEITFAASSTHRSSLTVFCDGDPWRDIHISIFGRRPSLPSFCGSENEFKELFAKVEIQMAKRYALKRLAMQSLLSDSLIRSLKERHVSKHAIDAVVTELTSLGWLNDERWTESFVRVQSSRKVGPRAIAQKLASKGVKGERLEAAMGDVLNDEEQKQQILSLIKGKYKARNLKDFKERQKVVAALIRRGFELSLIFSTLSNHVVFEDVCFDS